MRIQVLGDGYVIVYTVSLRAPVVITALVGYTHMIVTIRYRTIDATFIVQTPALEQAREFALSKICIGI